MTFLYVYLAGFFLYLLWMVREEVGLVPFLTGLIVAALWPIEVPLRAFGWVKSTYSGYKKLKALRAELKEKS